MQTYVRVVRYLSLVSGYIAAGMIAVGVLVVCHMVFVRYVLNHSTIWQTDLTTYLLIGATFIGSPYVLMTRGHVNVDVVPYYAKPRARRLLAVVAGGMTLAFALVLTVLTFNLWKEAWDQNWVSDTMWRSRLWIPYLAMPVGLALLALQAAADLIQVITGREPPFGMTSERKA